MAFTALSVLLLCDTEQGIMLDAIGDQLHHIGGAFTGTLLPVLQRLLGYIQGGAELDL